MSSEDISGRLIAELTGHGGPWGAPITDHGEVDDPRSGMHRAKVEVGADQRMSMSGSWVMTRFDDSRYVECIGLAATPESEFLVMVPVRKVVAEGDIVRLDGPLTITLS